MAHNATEAAQKIQGEAFVKESNHWRGRNDRLASQESIVMAKPAVKAASLSFSHLLAHS
jgi:hypothetical protein